MPYSQAALVTLAGQNNKREENVRKDILNKKGYQINDSLSYYLPTLSRYSVGVIPTCALKHLLK